MEPIARPPETMRLAEVSSGRSDAAFQVAGALARDYAQLGGRTLLVGLGLLAVALLHVWRRGLLRWW